MILYCDGGSKGFNSHANADGVYCSVYDDHKEQVVIHQLFPHYKTNNEAEFCAINEALEYAMHNMDPIDNMVTICGDSQLAIYGVIGKYKIRQPNLLPLLMEARGRIRALEQNGISVVFEWVPRKEVFKRLGH